jgi:isopenicillin N synthase-like dioxygenase
VDLAVVDISTFIADPTTTSPAAHIVIDRAFQGFQETGFIVLTGHGLSPEAIARQFDLGKMFLGVSEEVKHEFHANICEGSWAGYKARNSSLLSGSC